MLAQPPTPSRMIRLMLAGCLPVIAAARRFSASRFADAFSYAVASRRFAFPILRRADDARPLFLIAAITLIVFRRCRDA